MEKRVLIAFVLSAAIFVVWTALFPPPKPPQPVPAVEGSGASTTVEAEGPQEPVPGEETSPAEEAPAEVEEQVTAAVAGDREEVVTLTNDVVEVGISNRGGAITSLILVGYTGDDGKPLDMIQTLDQPWRALPLQLVTDDGPERALYAVDVVGNEVSLRWSDGAGNTAEKVISLAESGYGIDVAVHTTGKLEEAELAVATGLRDTSPAEQENRFSTWGDAAVLADGEIEEYKREKLKASEVLRPGQTLFAGFADTYFLHVFQTQERLAEIVVEPFEFQAEGAAEKDDPLRVLQVRLSSEAGSWRGRLFSAPKEYDLLQREGGGLERTLDFGFFHPISVFFLLALHWIHGVVGNYGWAIVLLTLGIRIVLFPLMHTSTVSMRRMQKVQPKAKAIQEKYKKNKSDPQVRAKMNQEMMALYKAEGVNPMGGCLPVLVQLPILWALYTLFAHAIELRHAPFMMWIVDLSAKDPLYITPVLMTGTMWLQQRLAPQAGDPQQQKIFRMMPLIFGIMFLGFPAGLVLYWLTNNVITIFQQELTLRLIGERGSKSGGKGKGKG